jgi:uncharacterized membrane protein
MVVFQNDTEPGECRIVISPNRSISWAQLVSVYLFICLTSFSIALVFAFLGYWVVLPFSGLEMLVLGVALYWTNKMFLRKEVISSSNGVVKIEKGYNHPDQSWEFDLYWTQINLHKGVEFHAKTFIYMGSHGRFVELGSFLNEAEKESLVFALNEGIISAGFLGQPVSTSPGH